MEGAVEYNIESLKPSPLNIRHGMDLAALEELAASIRAHGIIEPLVVREAPGSGWEVIAGCRRLEAAKMARLKKVPVVIRRHLSDRDALEIILIENCQREDLDPIDRAKAYKRLMDDYELRQVDLGERLGVPPPTISNYLQLLALPEDAQREIASGRLAQTAGIALARIADQPEVYSELYAEAQNGTRASVIRSRARAHALDNRSARGSSKDSLQVALNDLQMAVEQARDAEWEPVCRNSLKTCDDRQLILEIAAWIRVKAGLPSKPRRSYIPPRWLEGKRLIEDDGLSVKEAAARMNVTPPAVAYWLKRIREVQGV